MKKKIIVLIILICIVICCIVCAICISNRKKVDIDVISDYLEINISESAKIDYIDEHDSFFGEGFTIMKISDNNLIDKIEKSHNWRKDSDEYTQRLNGIKSEMSKTYSKISKISNYYWIYKNNYMEPDKIQYIEQMEDNPVETYSYFVGIYDIDNNVLYYYHMNY